MAPASKSKNFAVESAFMNELVTLFSDSDLTTLELETDEIADIAPDLPEEVLKDLLENLDIQNRERLQSVLSYPEDSVGSLMEFEITTIREDLTLEVVLNYLRKIKNVDDIDIIIWP